MLLVYSLVCAAGIAPDQSFRMFSRRHSGPFVGASSSSLYSRVVDAIHDSISDRPMAEDEQVETDAQWLKRRKCEDLSKRPAKVHTNNIL